MSDSVKVIQCNCKSTYQDSKYGLGKRVHNAAPKSNGYRCTVCASVKSGSKS